MVLITRILSSEGLPARLPACLPAALVRLPVCPAAFRHPCLSCGRPLLPLDKVVAEPHESCPAATALAAAARLAQVAPASLPASCESPRLSLRPSPAVAMRHLSFLATRARMGSALTCARPAPTTREVFVFGRPLLRRRGWAGTPLAGIDIATRLMT